MAVTIRSTTPTGELTDTAPGTTHILGFMERPAESMDHTVASGLAHAITRAQELTRAAPLRMAHTVRGERRRHTTRAPERPCKRGRVRVSTAVGDRRK